jgi:hypothetical protein
MFFCFFVFFFFFTFLQKKKIRCAFVGFALLDANIHGLIVGQNLMEMDYSNFRSMDDVLPAVFSLCENEALQNQILSFQQTMSKCWRERG